jgi:hypothetical protein
MAGIIRGDALWAQFEEAVEARNLLFSLDWPQWSEGTAAAFRSRYPQEHKRSPPQNANVLLKGVQTIPQRSKVKGLAAIELVATQIGYGHAEVGFDLSCGKAFLFGVPITIRVGEVAWDCGGGQLDPSTRQGRLIPVQFGNVQLQWNGGDSFNPAWRVESEGPSIGNLDVPPDFARVIGLTAGSKLSITFGVWRPDIEEDDHADSGAIEAAYKAISTTLESDSDPSNLSLIKRRILMRLATDALERHADFIILAKHEITFIANDESN